MKTATQNKGKIEPDWPIPGVNLIFQGNATLGASLYLETNVDGAAFLQPPPYGWWCFPPLRPRSFRCGTASPPPPFGGAAPLPLLVVVLRFPVFSGGAASPLLLLAGSAVLLFAMRSNLGLGGRVVGLGVGVWGRMLGGRVGRLGVEYCVARNFRLRIFYVLGFNCLALTFEIFVVVCTCFSFFELRKPNTKNFKQKTNNSHDPKFEYLTFVTLEIF